MTKALNTLKTAMDAGLMSVILEVANTKKATPSPKLTKAVSLDLVGETSTGWSVMPSGRKLLKDTIRFSVNGLS